MTERICCGCHYIFSNRDTYLKHTEPWKDHVIHTWSFFNIEGLETYYNAIRDRAEQRVRREILREA